MSDAVTADEFDLFFEKESAKDAGTEVEDPAKAEAAAAVDGATVDDGGASAAGGDSDLGADGAVSDAEKLEADKLAAEKADAEKLEADKLAAEKAEAEKVETVAQKAAEKIAADKAESERLAAEKAVAKEAKAPKVIDYTDEEKAAIAEEAKEWPEVAAARAAQARVMTERFEQMMDQKLADMQKSLEPVFQTSQTVARNSYEAEILGKHADAFERMDELTAWIEGQPALIKKAYNYVLDNPVPPSEVIELFDIFKEATKAPDVVADEPDPEIAAETQRKLDAQEGVRSRRTDTKKDTGPLDFESAFNQVK